MIETTGDQCSIPSPPPSALPSLPSRCVWAFSGSKGWYAGGALTLQLLCGLGWMNEQMYGKKREGGREGGNEGGMRLADILGGKVGPPLEAQELYKCLEGLTK